MPSEESSDEALARELVERQLGVGLTFADNDPHEGRVDYTFTTLDRRTAAIEVTRLTDEDMRMAASAYGKHIAGPLEVPALACCWSVVVDEKKARYRGLPERVAVHLLALESTGLQQGRIHHVEALWVKRETRIAALGLAREFATFVQSHPALCAAEGSDHRHVVAIDRASGGSAAGSDAALGLIEEELRARPDNVHKVSAAGVDVGCIFLWLDGKTDYEVSRPFHKSDSAPLEHFQLPTRPPRLPSPIEWLWVVHEGTRVGWRWDGSAWSGLG